jgi:hypothetical protein
MSKPSKALEGRKVRLIRCNDSYTKLEPGTTGTVELVDDMGTLHVKWDNGSSLGLCWDDGDRWSILT